MENNTLQHIIRSSQVTVHRGRYGYFKTDEQKIGPHFLISQDADEVTVVTEESNAKNIQYTDFVGWFKLIEVKVSEPFVAKGFLAKITKTIADKDLNVLVVSTFSKDYILVREETYELAVDALKEVGFPVSFE